MKCPQPQCGAENAEGAQFCGTCGVRLISDAVSSKNCPACGREVPAEARFCGKCGCPIGDGAADEPTSTGSLLIPERPPAEDSAPEPSDYFEATTQPASADDPEGEPVTTPVVDEIQAPTDIGKPLLMLASGVTVVILVAIGIWVYMTSSPAEPPAAMPPVVPMPTEAPPLSTMPPAVPVAPPSTAAPIVDEAPAPAAAAVATPFQPLVTSEPPSALPPTDEEVEAAEAARARAERARQRRAARRAAREAAEREAAQREAEAAAAAAAAASRPASPGEACANESGLIARNSCEARVCQLREWMFHPFCVERRRREERKRQGSSAGFGY